MIAKTDEVKNRRKKTKEKGNLRKTHLITIERVYILPQIRNKRNNLTMQTLCQTLKKQEDFPERKKCQKKNQNTKDIQRNTLYP